MVHGVGAPSGIECVGVGEERFRASYFAQHLRETGGEIGAYVGKVARFAEMNLYCHETVFQRHIEHACAGYESFQLVEKVGMRVGAQVREEYSAIWP